MNRILVELCSDHPSTGTKTTFEISGKLSKATLVECMNAEVGHQQTAFHTAGNAGAKVNALGRLKRLENLASIVRKNFGRKKPCDTEVSGGRHLRYWNDPIGGHTGDMLVISQSPKFA